MSDTFQLTLFGGSALSTSSAAGSRAKTSVRPGEARALRAAARVYGERCLGLSVKSDPLGASLRTYLRSACEVLTGFSLHWKESVTPAGHWWLQLGPSDKALADVERGLWGSPRVTTGKYCYSNGVHARRVLTLEGQVFAEAELPVGEGPNMNGKPRGSLNSAWVMQLMGWPEDYAAELTKACLGWQETVGSHKSRS